MQYANPPQPIPQPAPQAAPAPKQAHKSSEPPIGEDYVDPERGKRVDRYSRDYFEECRQKELKSKAVKVFIMSLIALDLAPFLSVLGFILGIVAKIRATILLEENRAFQAKGLTTAGKVME